MKTSATLPTPFASSEVEKHVSSTVEKPARDKCFSTALETNGGGVR